MNQPIPFTGGAVRIRVTFPLIDSESIGSSSVIGDSRWAGDYGVNADLIAVTHCSAEFIPLEEILVQNISLAIQHTAFC
jgi:hypothetical protein